MQVVPVGIGGWLTCSTLIPAVVARIDWARSLVSRVMDSRLRAKSRVLSLVSAIVMLPPAGVMIVPRAASCSLSPSSVLSVLAACLDALSFPRFSITLVEITMCLDSSTVRAFSTDERTEVSTMYFTQPPNCLLLTLTSERMVLL